MKPKILFIHENERDIKDGLWAALELLKTDFDIERRHIYALEDSFEADFVLGWGAFGSLVDQVLSTDSRKKGLCIGGTAGSPNSINAYDVVFYETQWDYDTRLKQSGHDNLIHAFGINTDIFKKNQICRVEIFDYLTVGAFSLWKRQHLISEKVGLKMAVGQVQKNNLSESMGIVFSLLGEGVVVVDQVSEIKLAQIYNASRVVYLPAELHGGDERALLEARSCGCIVEIEDDNPKLKELLTAPIWDHKYYAEQLKKGIMSVL